MITNRPASVHARLLNRANSRGEDFNLLLDQYAVERLLYRLSISDAAGHYYLKGALLFALWFDHPHRPTRDADLLRPLNIGPAALADELRHVCGIAVDDGMTYDPDSLRIGAIRKDARYGGLRAHVGGHLGNARLSVHIDIGTGDVITPGPDDVTYPTLLAGQPAARLRAYPRQTVVAEKLEAIVQLGMANSRMKDYFDLRALAQEGRIEPELLVQAIAATFARRGTPMPNGLPVGLTAEFADDAGKQVQWRAFLRKNRLPAAELGIVVSEISEFVAEPLRRAASI